MTVALCRKESVYSAMIIMMSSGDPGVHSSSHRLQPWNWATGSVGGSFQVALHVQVHLAKPIERLLFR